jgi:hypothetical protein
MVYNIKVRKASDVGLDKLMAYQITMVLKQQDGDIRFAKSIFPSDFDNSIKIHTDNQGDIILEREYRGMENLSVEKIYAALLECLLSEDLYPQTEKNMDIYNTNYYRKFELNNFRTNKILLSFKDKLDKFK